MKDHPNDVSVLGDAKRCFDMMGILSATVHMIQSIPGQITCFLFEICEVSEAGDSDNSNDDEEEESEDDEVGEDEDPEDEDPEDKDPEVP